MNKNTLCSAAWTDLNVDFANQTIKHCCMMQNEKFPDAPYDDFWNNSERIQQVRSDLLNGIQNSACSYCWNSINKTGTGYKDLKNKWKSINDFNEKIKIIEITLDNLCDMSCVYCFEDTSSRIAQEKNMPEAIKTKPQEVFIDSFINFLIKLTETQEVSLSFSGGEVSYSKNFFSFVNKLLSIPELQNRKLYISVISNCNSLEKNQKKMIALIDSFPDNWGFNIAISNESFGEVAETVRYGLDWERFKKNYSEYVSHPKINFIVLSPAFSVFTVKHMYKYFEYMLGEAEKHKDKITVSMYGNWIQSPKELDPARLPPEHKSYVKETKELFTQYKHLFKDNFEFSFNSLSVLESRIGTAPEDLEELAEWAKQMSKQKKDPKILNLLNRIKEKN